MITGLQNQVSGVRASLPVLNDTYMFQKVIAYCKDSYDELSHKTTWPTRKELTHSAIVVLTASIIIAIVVYLMDTVFESIMQLIYPQI